MLADESITYLGSSPAVRCVETLAPLVPQLEIDVHVLPALAEGADVDESVDLVISLAGDNAALCAHGDLIPAIIDELVDRGMVVKDASAGKGAASRHAVGRPDGGPAVNQPIVSQKGSVWAIEFDGSTPTRGTYHPPA